MKIAITGQGVLAGTTRECCKDLHEIEAVESRHIEVLWVCYDTPVSENGEADYEWVIGQIQADLNRLNGDPVVLMSSQLSVLTTFRLSERFPLRFFAYSPENVRVNSAVDDFMDQKRIVVGVPNGSRNSVLKALLTPICGNLIFTTCETAELVKHALNCYLGMSIAYINEIAKVAAHVKADMDVVSKALLTERRISPNAPLKAGAPFGGGHLMRDIKHLESLAGAHGLKLPIITHIRESNAH